MLCSPLFLVLFPLLVLRQTALAEDAQNNQDVDEVVVAAGVAELQDLLVRLETESNITITNLLLSDIPRNGSDASTDSDTPPPCADLVPMLNNVLNRTQHTLSTLALLEYQCANSNSSFVDEVLRSHALPRLSHLTVGTTDAWSPRIQNAIVRHKQTLTHLHIATSFETVSYNEVRSPPPSLPTILKRLPGLTELTVAGVQGLRRSMPEVDRFPMHRDGHDGLLYGAIKLLGRTVFGPSLVPKNFNLSIRPGPNPGRDDTYCGFTSAEYGLFVHKLKQRKDLRVLGSPCKAEFLVRPNGVEYDPYIYDVPRPATLEHIYPLGCAIDETVVTAVDLPRSLLPTTTTTDSMESLPPELHDLIFDTLACTTFKSIGAVASTSTYFHALAAPYRFHTLVFRAKTLFTSINQLRWDLEHIPTARRRIHRVFITLHSSTRAQLPTLIRILQLAGPTLRDLAVVSQDASSVFASASAFGAIARAAGSFPHLEALTLHGAYPPLPNGFPALRVLNVSGNIQPVGLPCPRSWLDHPGRLTTLRVGGLRGALGFTRELCAVLVQVDGEEESSDRRRWLDIHIELSASGPAEKWDDVIREMLAEAASRAKAGVRVEVVTAGDERDIGQRWLEGE
ncbi:hypothetical protein HMN09_00667500 [Mycena chlorophos]|uniref:F-box domain-containing protein n=1 Tax=Mycena chlorophos TaxID=658473 RepID=A0A8H6T0L8_MYCCL|nr:hypothetical protein HMN09_00667500 [Mycena chlorophos]